MKRFALTLLCLICFINLGFSQEDEEEIQDTQAKFGFKAGINLVAINIVLGPTDTVQNETGFFVGGFVNIPVADHFSVQTELLYSSTQNLFGNDSMGLLHLPVLAKYDLGDKFTAYIGLEGQLLLSLGDTDTDLFNSLILGLDFGGTYEFTYNFFIDARYNFAFTKLLDLAPDAYRKFNTLQIGLAFMFD